MSCFGNVFVIQCQFNNKFRIELRIDGFPIKIFPRLHAAEFFDAYLPNPIASQPQSRQSLNTRASSVSKYRSSFCCIPLRHSLPILPDLSCPTVSEISYSAFAEGAPSTLTKMRFFQVLQSARHAPHRWAHRNHTLLFPIRNRPFRYS